LRNISATGSVSYALTASGAFSLPHYTILATAKTAQFEQKYQWKRALDISPDLLKYSLVEN
jgi:hypothetical protein